MNPTMKAILSIDLCGSWCFAIANHTGRKRIENLGTKFFKCSDQLHHRITSGQKNRLRGLTINAVNRFYDPSISEAAILIASFAGTAISFLETSPVKEDRKLAKRIEELALSKSLQQIINDDVDYEGTHTLAYEWKKSLNLV